MPQEIAAGKPVSPRLAAQSERLFIALLPDAKVRAALAAAAAGFAGLGRIIPDENLHLTLAFLGSVPIKRRAQAARALREAHPEAFELNLDRFGYFANSGALWVGPGASPRALITLQRRLAMRLRAHGFKLEGRAFRPHVTLLRDGAQPDLASLSAAPAIAWRVTQAALVRSQPANGGSRYEVVDSVRC